MKTQQTGQSLEKTLPYTYYVDPLILEEEKQKIFKNSWIKVGHISEVAKPGDFFTFDLPGEPIVISRDQEGELRAFYNVCPHRGAKVEMSESGNKKVLLCKYHGWTFHMDGKLNKAPNFTTDELGEHSCMKPIQLEVYHGMIFINLNPDAQPFAVEYEKFMEDTAPYTFLSSLKKARVNTRIVKANWKAVIDNYLECDHCPVAHPGFSRTFNLDQYSIVPCDNFSYQCSTVRGAEDGAGARFYWVWPNLMLSIYPGSGNMTTSQIIPIDAENTLAIYSYYFADETPSKEEDELMAFVDQVREEDFELVEMLQIGFRSQAFETGVYSPTEHALHHFHQLMKQALGK